MAVEDADAPTSWASEMSKRLASLALRASTLCTRKTHMAHLLLSPFAAHLYELATLMQEIQREWEIRGGQRLASSSTSKMDSELKSAEHIINVYAGSCSLYMLMCSPELLQQLKMSYAGFKSALDSLSKQDSWSNSLKIRLSEEHQSLHRASSTKLNPKEQSLQDSLDPGVLDSIVSDLSHSTMLAKQIAESLGFASLKSEGFLNEIHKLKMEKDAAESRRGPAHGLYLQQFITLLEKAVSATLKSRSGSLRSQSMSVAVSPTATPTVRDTLILPLQSFICPITQDVMRDPVQIASGQTYERSAIERWFAEGHTRCPTGVELANTNMKSNIALKQSIAEWRERNNTIRLNNVEEHLNMGDSGNTEEQLKALENLQALCEEESLYKYKAASQGLVPSIVHLAQWNDLELRQKALCMLGVLADNEECQEIMVKEKVIELAVRCLARQKDEAALCVQLLRTLSTNASIAEKISHAPSAVLFLVTLIHNEQCADNVKTILDNLPKSDENIITIAEANIIEPLVTRLIEGEMISKVRMAKKLAELQMPDSTKATVANHDGAIQTLVKMSESYREEERETAVMALASLSSVAAGRQRIQAAGSWRTLLGVLQGVRHSEAAKIGSATALANVWSDEANMDDAQLEEVICTYTQLLGSTTPVRVQEPLLQGFLCLARGPSDDAREKMKELNALTYLFRLFHSATNGKAYAPLLSSCLEVIACLTTYFPEETGEALLGPPPGSIQKLAELVIQADARRNNLELQSVISIFASLPIDKLEVTNMMVQEQGLLESLIKIFKNHGNEGVVEEASGALLRFTVPEDVEMQTKLATAGVLDTYVALLRTGSAKGKQRAAQALFNFSKSTKDLSEDAEWGGAVVATGGWKTMMSCFAGPQRRSGMCCKVHGGLCSVGGTFCLMAAGNGQGVNAVVDALMEGGSCAVAAMGALGTLLEGERVEEGCAVIDKAGGMKAVIALMGSNHGTHVQMEAARLCEKFFSILKYRHQYASQAQMHIITLVQMGNPALRQLAGRLLRDLDLIQSQSNYFGAASITAS